MDNCNTTPNQSVKGTYDPGWNDPPKFTYNAQQTTPGRPRNFLNKRVAFPLSNSSTPTPPAPVNLPPMPALVPSAPPIYSNNVKNQIEDVQMDSENILKEVKGSLLEILENSIELGSKANDIKRRIAIMEEMWLGGKLNNNVYMQMKDLASCLKGDEPMKADEIHRALMVDHVSVVGTWMPGVKQLIHNSIARSELLAIEATDDS